MAQRFALRNESSETAEERREWLAEIEQAPPKGRVPLRERLQTLLDEDTPAEAVGIGHRQLSLSGLVLLCVLGSGVLAPIVPPVAVMLLLMALAIGGGALVLAGVRLAGQERATT